jgi:hypothetical protein
MKLYICKDLKNAEWRKNVLNGEKISLAFAKKCICDYIGETESSIEFSFVKNKYGKPFISSLYKIRNRQKNKIKTNVYFSLSHSGDILICAVSHYNIGADCQIINIKDIKVCRQIAKEQCKNKLT